MVASVEHFRLLHPTPPPATHQSSSDEENEQNIDYPLLDLSEPPELSGRDPLDVNTADSWIARHPSLVRLTGKHPFNSEPPLPLLMRHGFITPVPLHYVRNHGAVPGRTADLSTWTVEIRGLVARPASFTVPDLARDFPSFEIPVTLVCAGNRRKEQNMVRQTVGFNWGPASISTSAWRGVRLRDVLRRCGIMGRRDGALNVCFEGAEDLPGDGGGGSKYGTSLRKEVAMDPSRDIMIAYMQNGQLLTPDHGFPCRMIIPGFIGGRMVKWLTKITVTASESESYYHYKDNRVFPSHVDAELADAEGWWYKPEYIINELNINSVITSPGHDEILPINSATTEPPYILRGYAYSGMLNRKLLSDLLKNNKVCLWADICQKVFEDLDVAFSTEPVLATSDFNKRLEIHMEASDFAIDGVLIPKGPPLAFESHKLNEAERRYTDHEKEMTFFIYYFQVWRHTFRRKRNL